MPSLQAKYDGVSKEKTKIATKLAYSEVIDYNKKNLERGSEQRPAAKQRKQKAEEI